MVMAMAVAVCVQACSQERVLEQMSKRCGLLESRLESLAPAVQQAGQLREANKV